MTAGPEYGDVLEPSAAAVLPAGSLDTVPRRSRLLPEGQRVLVKVHLDLAKAAATSANHRLGGSTPVGQLMAEVLVRQGLYEYAEEVLPRQPAGDAPLARRTRWAVTAAAIKYWGAGDVEAAHRVLRDVGSPVTAAHRAGLLLLDGRTRAALAAGENVLADRPVPDEAIPPAVITVVVAAGLAGRFGQALAAATRPGRGRPRPAEIGYAHCFVLLLAGQVRQAHRMADDGYRDAVAAGSVAVAGGWLALRGAAAKTRGDLTAAIADLETASHLFDGGSSGPLLAPCLAELAVARAVSGDLAGAEQTRQLADAAPGCRMFVPWLTLSRAWITAAGGDTTLAARQARTAADVAMASGQYAVEAMARYDVSRLGDPNAVRHRLAELADVVQGPLVPVMASAAAALARSDPGALDVATAKFTELGMDLFAAETATAAAALRQAAAPAGGVARPDAATPLLRLTARLAGLTRRERDVALLAAGGFTSPAIGHRLGLSARTVDNYLGRAYQKLGVTSRRELAPLVAGDRPHRPVHAEGNHR
ncbi:helix-turn-helix transcriptional regulator [Amycolatopsis sp. NBC_01307]|uniref:helix-turn-helix transcriptional regulator n=1 Tax=Amycolatopsis sp. NBC_01307 TaxID=2903561 RepID=UPI002E14FEDC|nr:helix-turn-helix transcriptional regulator [Amycolatopsis sp. NBC_01307]